MHNRVLRPLLAAAIAACLFAPTVVLADGPAAFPADSKFKGAFCKPLLTTTIRTNL